MDVFFLYQMVAKPVKDQMLELVRKVICDLNDNVIAEIESFYNHNIIFIVEQDEELIMRAVVILNYDLFFRIVLRPQEWKLEPFIKMCLKVPYLINSMIDGHKRDVLGLLAKSSIYNLTNPFEVDIIDRVEVIITIVPNQMHGILINQHHTPHLLIIKSWNYLRHQYFFLVIFIFPLRLLWLHVDLVEIVTVIEDKRRGLWAKEEALVFLDVGGIKTIIFPDLAVDKREGDDLVVDGEVEFILAAVEVKTGQEVVLNLLLDCHLIEGEVQHIGLEDYKLTFWGFLYTKEFVLHLDNVC